MHEKLFTLVDGLSLLAVQPASAQVVGGVLCVTGVEMP